MCCGDSAFSGFGHVPPKVGDLELPYFIVCRGCGIHWAFDDIFAALHLLQTAVPLREDVDHPVENSTGTAQRFFDTHREIPGRRAF